MFDLYKNDAAMRLIFDHLRNVAICAGVAAAASWKYEHVPQGMTIGAAIEYAALVLLVCTAIFLFFMNMRHGVRKAIELGFQPRRSPILLLGYPLVTASVIFSLLKIG